MHSYDSAYPPLEESLAQNYTGDSTVINEDGTEEVLMRVVILGGGDEEGQFVKNLSEKGAGKLVDGLYVLWDPRQANGRPGERGERTHCSFLPFSH